MRLDSLIIQSVHNRLIQTSLNREKEYEIKGGATE